MVQPIPDKESPAIRVLIANVPTTLEARLSRAIEEQEDIELVGQTRSNIDMLLAAQYGVDVVVLCAEEVHPPPRHLQPSAG